MWDQIIKSITAGVAVIGALIAVFNYLHSRDKEVAEAMEARRKEIVVAKRQSQQPFLSLQLQLYDEATKVAADLANLPKDEAKWSDAKARFLQLFWGELVLVEDAAVATAMGKVRDALVKFEKDGNQAPLIPAARDLAEACRQSVERSWDYELPGLK